MSNLINRQEAIKAINDLPNCQNGFSDTYDKAYIIGTLEELPTTQQWISCSERLPEQIGDYLITIRQSYNDSILYDTDVATFVDGSWVTFSDWDEGFGFDVVAWCELPEPYKEDNNE